MCDFQRGSTGIERKKSLCLVGSAWNPRTHIHRRALVFEILSKFDDENSIKFYLFKMFRSNSQYKTSATGYPF
ncbi:UNVERIFIED_CONTAM: hypothetical protein PYX00_009042 [Menopon gallinae]|uniref:Uncharacterized protein n=1 Tax=Menopon gallinae TaxID=328185 RepID=A0AAW2H9W4_9NEOP